MQQQPGGNGLPAGLGAGGSSGGPAYPPGAAAYVQQFYAQQALADDLTKFWKRMAQEVDEHSDALADFKSQALPLARIKKVSMCVCGGGAGSGEHQLPSACAWRSFHLGLAIAAP